MKTRITINGREVDRLDALPPEVRRAYEDAMQRVSGPRDGVVVENQIVVNGQTFSRPEDMPPDVRRLHDEAMDRARRRSGIRITHARPTFSIRFTLGGRPASSRGTADGPIEPSAIESRMRYAVVALALAVIGGLAAWALLGR